MHNQRWTPQEDAELIASIGARLLTTTAHKLGRTPSACADRACYVLGIDTQHEARRVAGMTLSDVADALGVELNRVRDWIRNGWLKTHTGYGIRVRYTSIDAWDVSAFLAERGGLLDCFKPFDLAWKEEIDQARSVLYARYIHIADLRATLRWGRSMVGHQADFPTPLIVGHRWYFYERSAVRAWLAKHPHYWTKDARAKI